jgi:hypothetical protein
MRCKKAVCEVFEPPSARKAVFREMLAIFEIRERSWQGEA